VDDGDVGLAGELLAQGFDEAVIEFDGDDATGMLGKAFGQHPAAWAYFEHRVGGSQVGGGDDVVAVGFVDQEVLGQRLFGR
jgi:hypothetical protein